MSRLSALLACLAVVSCSRQAAPAPSSDTNLPAVRYEAHVVAGTVAPSGAELTNPHNADPAVAKKGALLFTAHELRRLPWRRWSAWVRAEPL